MKKALILGIGGQDGSYLADILLEQGWEVHGLVRRSSANNLWRIDHCSDKVTLHKGDLLDPLSLRRVIDSVAPEVIYNEADQDHVGYSHEVPSVSCDVTYKGVANLLEILREFPRIKLFQPLSATMFGNALGPQTLETPFSPQSPYAVAKVAAYYLCKHYRERYNLRITCGILYNHDSIRRQGDYLLHKICKAAVRIFEKDQEYLMLSNLEMKVDVGSAREFMWLISQIMQVDKAVDVVIGTGVATSIRELVMSAFHACIVPMDKLKEVEWESSGTISQSSLVADTSTCRELTGYYPTRSVHGLIREICSYYHNTLYGAKT